MTVLKKAILFLLAGWSMQSQILFAEIGQTQDNAAIKAGTLTFAHLETFVDESHLTPQIIATIIDGNLRGAKLTGKLAKNANGKKVLIFNQIDVDPKKKIKAYAIEWDDARVGIVTEADFVYLKKRGVNMASNFLNHYSNHKQVKLGAGTDFGILFMQDA